MKAGEFALLSFFEVCERLTRLRYFVAMKFDCSTSGGGWGYDGGDDEDEDEERDEIDY